MFLEIDEGFLEHPKTLQLCATLQNPLAFGYLLHFWKWAVRSCKTGNLCGMSVYAIEEAARYPQHDGKLYAAMTATVGGRPGFIDVDEQGPTAIHNWSKRTGGSIQKMEEKALQNKLRREAARKRHEAGEGSGSTGIEPESSEPRTGIVPESYRNRTGTNPTRQDQTRPEQTRQDKTRQDQIPPRARDPLVQSTHGTTGLVAKKIRPRTAHDLTHCLRVAVEREQPGLGFWNPGGSFADKEAREFLEAFADIEAALSTIESRIELFARDKTYSPWTVAKFAKAFNGIGQMQPARASPRAGGTGIPENWKEQRPPWESNNAE